MTISQADVSWSAETELKVSASRKGAEFSNTEFSNTDDAVDLYLNEIGRVPRIDHADEIELSRAVQEKLAVDRAREELTERLPVPPADTQIAAYLGIEVEVMKRRLHRGDRAQRRLVEANLRLVVSVAKKYLNRGVPFLDLIQEGNIGLMRATERFDAERGYRFSTYAHWWIRQGVTRCIANQARTIRLPVHMVDKVRHLKRTIRDLGKQLGRSPSEAELAAAMGIKIKKLRTIQQSASLPVSLDLPVGSEGETRLGDLIEDKQSDRPFQDIVATSMQSDVRRAMDRLKPVEQEVLELRYGFNGGKAMTLREVGEHFNLTRERIRQIEKEALRKLRTSYNQRHALSSYLGS
ncbi:MAG: RpoD/SigA family RNA polymerase sigma factor [Cyanobacteria bacterium J06648_11]